MLGIITKLFGPQKNTNPIIDSYREKTGITHNIFGIAELPYPTVTEPTIENMSVYADRGAIILVHKNLIEKDVAFTGDMKDINLSSIGNAAYVAKNHSDETMRKKAEDMFDKIKFLVNDKRFKQETIEKRKMIKEKLEIMSDEDKLLLENFMMCEQQKK